MWTGNEPAMTQTEAAQAMAIDSAQRDCGFHWKELQRLADVVASHVRMMGNDASETNYVEAKKLLDVALDHSNKLYTARVILAQANRQTAK